MTLHSMLPNRPTEPNEADVVTKTMADFDLAERCQKIASGEIPAEFHARDWRHDGIAVLLWNAGEEIKRLRSEVEDALDNAGYLKPQSAAYKRIVRGHK